MKTTAHPYALTGGCAPPEPEKPPYRIIDFPSGNLLSVDIGDGDVLMDRDQAIELLRVLQLAVPELTKENT